MAAVRHLGFKKFEILTVDMVEAATIVPDFVKSAQTVAEIRRFNGFYKVSSCQISRQSNQW